MTPQSFPIWKLSNAWISTAEMLKRSADKLLFNYQLAYQELNRQTSHAIASGERTQITLPPDLDLYCPYMLLMGYAIENLIKGAIICGTGLNDPDFGGAVNFDDFRAVNRENGAPWTIDQHGFINLLKVTAIRADIFNDDEKEVLQYLDIIIKWGGRYPVPKRQEPGRSSGFVCAEPPYIGSRNILPIPAVNSIYEKALEEMRRVCSQYQAED